MTFLTEGLPAQLPPDTRPLPSVATYDQLPQPRRPDRFAAEGDGS
ncbi:hypothetical protein [Streptomyces olivaceoviridis]|nr:hypothetical protein [Streptomyces olivaceoviridis]